MRIYTDKSSVAQRSTPATSTAEITSLPVSALKGRLSAELRGNTVVNILPDTVAGCEANTGWTASSGSIATDNSNEIEGTNCLKPVLGAASDTYDYDILSMLATGRYYLLSGYIKNGNATNIKLGLETDDQDVSTSVVTATTYNRVGVVIAPTDFNTATSAVMRITVTGSAGQYAYFDALMLQEITSAEYALGASSLLTKYAFHLGTKSTDRVAVKSVGKNLFNKATVTEEYKIVNTTGALSASAGNGASDFVRITGGGSYKLSGTTGTTVLEGAYYDINKTYISGFTSYTTLTVPANAFYIRFTLINSANDTAMLEAGSTATTYTAYTETTAVLPNELKKVSSTVYDVWDANVGKYTKNISDWVTLSGNAFTWSLYNDTFTGFQTVSIPLSSLSGVIASDQDKTVIKYNGKTLANSLFTAGDTHYTGATVFYIHLFDTDTGWDESWASGTSFTGMTWGGLIKAYMNGWKMTTTNTNVASAVWTGITSGTVKNAGAADYTHVTTTIDTGFTPYKMIYQLATPVVTNYFPNILNSEPSGTVYDYPFIEDYDFYNSGAFVRNTSYPINSLEYVYTVDRTTGVMTPIALSTCTVAAGGLSFTSTALAANDVVMFGYTHKELSTVPDLYYSYDLNTIGAIEDNSLQIRDLDNKIEQHKFLTDQRFDGMWVDYNVGAVSLGAGASAPDLVAIDSGTILLPAFDGGSTTEQLFGCIELNHDYKEGTDITFHVHWMPTTADAGNVLFKLTYDWVSATGTSTAGTSVDLSTVAAGGTAWVNKISTVSISGTGKTIGSQFSFRLYRDPTVGGDTYGADVLVKTVGLHVQVDSIGSRAITTK